jgi:hypothetical protein
VVAGIILMSRRRKKKAKNLGFKKRYS